MEHNQATIGDNPHIILETNRRLSQSLLWKVQRRFFNQKGVRAWSEGKVPHYVTNNPFIANAYGQVVFGFLRDCQAASTTRGVCSSLNPAQPVYLIELGAGSGRFAYHFLKQFLDDYPCSVLKDIPIKYIMTDFALANLDFWQAHPALRPYVEQGVLDFACFDAEKDQHLQLRHAGQTLSAATLKNPLIVLANYFFDSIPQDLFYIQQGQLYETLLTLSYPEPDPDYDDPEFLARLEIAYEDRPAMADYYDDPDFNRILGRYQQRLSDTAFLLPSVGLQCLRNLYQLSGGRLLLLSGDKGHTQEETLLGQGKPMLTLHGSFSLMVNYHAIAQYTQERRGQALTPAYHPVGLTICAFMFGSPDHAYLETRQAYRQAIEKGGPDAFFALKQGIEPHYATLTLPQILAYLRLSGWDAQIFFGCFPTLMEQAESAADVLKQELYGALQNIWEMYYFIGEQRDLPFHLSMLLYSMGYYPEALEYLRYSLQLHGADPSTFHNMAMCHYRLRQLDQARSCLEQSLALNPGFEAARAMKIKLEGEIGHQPRWSGSGRGVEDGRNGGDPVLGLKPGRVMVKDLSKDE
jgi:tetratricopeptide (TPR) repeat protein